MTDDKADDGVAVERGVQDLGAENDAPGDAGASDEEIVLVLNASANAQNSASSPANDAQEPDFSLSSLDELIIDDATLGIAGLEEFAVETENSGVAATGKEETGVLLADEAPIGTCGPGFLPIQIVMGNVDDDSSSGLI